ncbi:MAG TPA: hypothetical protein VJ302_06985 [Blastocatellia bacterium]|nr:hypothetical protein [Blastocatellia bacterium]
MRSIFGATPHCRPLAQAMIMTKRFWTTSPYSRRSLLIALLLGLLVCNSHLGSLIADCAPVEPKTFVAFGPLRFYINNPQTFIRKTYDFTALSKSKTYSLRVDKDGVTNSVIKVNGIEVVKPADFQTRARTILKQLVLTKEKNQLTVDIRGIAGATLELSITVVDDNNPTITADPTPTPNGDGWNNTNVTVNFTCADTISGIASCTAPVTLTNETTTAGQVVNGTAKDKVGHIATTSATVKIDKTAPTLNVLSPASGIDVFMPELTITGTVSDALSGIKSVVCNGIPGTVTGLSFTCDTFADIGPNTLDVVATDVAGNTTTVGLEINGRPIIAFSALSAGTGGISPLGDACTPAVLAMGIQRSRLFSPLGCGCNPLSFLTGVTRRGIAITPDGHIAVVTNGTGTITIVDLLSNNLDSVDLDLTTYGLTMTEGVAITPDGKYALISGGLAPTIVSVQIDTVTPTVVNSLPILTGITPTPVVSVAITPDGTQALALLGLTNTVAVLTISNGVVGDPLTRVQLLLGPVANGDIAITPNGKRALVTNNVTNIVSVLNIASGVVTLGNTITGLGSIIFPAGNTFAVSVTLDGKKAYVSNFLDSTLAVLNIDSNDNVTDSGLRISIPILDGTPSPLFHSHPMAMTPDGLYLLVPSFVGNEITVIELATNTRLTPTIPVPAGTGPAAVAAAALQAPQAP